MVKNRLRAAVLAAATVFGIALSAAPAFADTYSSYTRDKEDTAQSPNWGHTGCWGQLDVRYNNTQGYWEAHASFSDGGVNWCQGVLERSSDGGATWKNSSNVYTFGDGAAAGTSAQTGWHWDGTTSSSVESRVCTWDFYGAYPTTCSVPW